MDSHNPPLSAENSVTFHDKVGVWRAMATTRITGPPSFFFKRPQIHIKCYTHSNTTINPYPTAFLYGNGMVLHFYQQLESSTTKTVHKVINKRLKTYVLSPHSGENFHSPLGTVCSVYRDRRFATLQRTLFIYLINKYISLSDICLTVHH